MHADTLPPQTGNRREELLRKRGMQSINEREQSSVAKEYRFL